MFKEFKNYTLVEKVFGILALVFCLLGVGFSLHGVIAAGQDLTSTRWGIVFVNLGLAAMVIFNVMRFQKRPKD
ncbi:MAG: hypothetical protein SPK50_10005 [Mobiluncus porci]|uniref:hypothetical protein n=1 Tax=Mobiluncus porci TaxID=2652278 RepID=UPI0023F29CA7|nr:hypothetical protein [Mobiluncus porci]MDD7542102.1 hypothetical protein [Mobiluncus porci]MDY5749445.1 hypothetical protein [Mobiluncus porci]